MSEITSLRCPISFNKKAEYDAHDLRFIEVTVDVLHTGANLNRSYLDKSVIDNAVDTIKNTPILGYVLYDDDGNVDDFKGHEHELRVDDNGVHYVYAGSAYGVIPESCNPRWIIKDDGNGVEREYLRVDGLLWTKFDAPVEIFQRDVVKNHSVELIEIKGQDGKDGLYHISKFKFDGCCILSTTDPMIQPAMTGSNVTANFSADTVAAQIKERLNEFSVIKAEFSSNKNDDKKGEFEPMKKKNDPVEPVVEPANSEPVSAEPNGTEPTEPANSEPAAAEPTNEPVADPEPTEPTEPASDPEPINGPEPIAEPAAPAEPDKSQSTIMAFSLSQGQMVDEIMASLHEIQIPDPWCPDCMMVRYGYCDIQDSEVIVMDYKDWNYYGIPFTMNGDNVVLEMENIKRKKVVWEDWDNGSSVANPFEQVFTKATARIDELSAALEQTADSYAEIKPKYDAYVQAEADQKAAALKAKRDALFEAMDEKLGDDAEYTALKENTEIEFSELETKCYALVGRKAAEFSYIPNKASEGQVRFGVGGSQNTKSAEAYGGLIEHYGVR